MKQRTARKNPQIMSAETLKPAIGLKVAVLWGLFATTGILLADEAAAPDLDFLEYLGSWEEGEEDWVLFASEETNPDTKNDEGQDPAPQGEEKLAELDQAELDDES